MTKKELISIALEASKNAYAPYSNYRVGCALLFQNGEIVTGCNVENASYGLTMCAERTALFNAVSQGYDLAAAKMLAIAADASTLVSPCGACRQVFVELLAMDLPVIMGNSEKYIETTVGKLMPLSFTGENL